MNRSPLLPRAAVAAIAAWFVTTARPVAADEPSVPALPVSTDLATVAVGSWAEYAISGGPASTTIRWALVTRTADGATLEVSVPDGELGKGKRGAIVQRMTVAPAGAKAPAVKGAAIQIANADPLAMSAKTVGAAPRLAPPDPTHKATQETVTVKAGTFTATKYRQTTAQGTLEYWVADNAAPLGIVKLTLTLPPKRKVVKKRGTGTVTVELVKTGSGATASITKASLALDPKNLAAARTQLGIAATPALKPIKPLAPIKVTPLKGNR